MLLTREEADRMAVKASRSPGVGSLRDSGYSEGGASSMELPRLDTDACSPTPFAADYGSAQMDEKMDSLALAKEAFAGLRKEQREQFGRVAMFESNQRKALIAHHQWSLEQLSNEFSSTETEMIKQVPRLLGIPTTKPRY